jgi:hypothetical protein
MARMRLKTAETKNYAAINIKQSQAPIPPAQTRQSGMYAVHLEISSALPRGALHYPVMVSYVLRHRASRDERRAVPGTVPFNVNHHNCQPINLDIFVPNVQQ